MKAAQVSCQEKQKQKQETGNEGDEGTTGQLPGVTERQEWDQRSAIGHSRALAACTGTCPSAGQHSLAAAVAMATARAASTRPTQAQPSFSASFPTTLTHFAAMKSRMFWVDPTTPMPLDRLASIARLNISPGTSK